RGRRHRQRGGRRRRRARHAGTAHSGARAAGHPRAATGAPRPLALPHRTTRASPTRRPGRPVFGSTTSRGASAAYLGKSAVRAAVRHTLEERPMNDVQQYLVEEELEHYRDGWISRREFLRRASLLGAGATAAAAMARSVV